MDNFLIPNISQKIKAILEKEHLKPKISPEQFIRKTKGLRHRYSSPCSTPNGNKIIFYARIQKNQDAKRKVRKETLFANFLQRERIREKIPFSDFLPRYLKGRIEKDFEWFEREYFEEDPLGDNESLKRGPDLTKKNLKKISQFLYLLSKSKPSFFKGIPLTKFPLENYKSIIIPLSFLKEKGIITQEEINLAEKFIRKYFSLFKKEHKYLSHGDFNLGNIIVGKNKLKIIDWESMEINNFAYDLSYLLCHLWEAKKWQRKYLIESYLSFLKNKKERENFTILLRGNLIYLTESGILARPKEIKRRLLKKRVIFFKELLKASLKGFKEILII